MSITVKHESGGENIVPKLHFTLTDIDVSVANALRRTILSDIPTICIRTETSEINKCKIEVNTSRMHNELVKQRLSCIPIHMDEQEFVKKHVVEVDVKNDTDSVMYVTTEHFKIKDKMTDQYLTREEVKKIFPPNPKTQSYIDFLRLRSAIGATIPGEHIKLVAEMSVSTAKENGMFNVVTVCSFQNKIDPIKVTEVWEGFEKKYESEKKPKEEIAFEKKNFQLLQAQRYFYTNKRGEANAFDFVIQSVGVYENTAIVHKACFILMGKFAEFIKNAEADVVTICESMKTKQLYHSVTESTIPFAFDIVLENEDYTMGCVLEKILFDLFYDKTMTYVGFKKYHPHDKYSIVRVAYKELTEKGLVKAHVIEACKEAQQTFSKIKNMFRD